MRFIHFTLCLILWLFSVESVLCRDSDRCWFEDVIKYDQNHQNATSSLDHAIKPLCNKFLDRKPYEIIATKTNLDQPQIQVYPFIDNFYSDLETKLLYGRLTIIEDPLRTVSVIEPRNPGGCNMTLLSTVADTGRRAQCHVAENAGFFDAENGTCFGNIISNGKIVSLTNVLNVNFGIRKSGSIVVGYLTEDEILIPEDPFLQLISGEYKLNPLVILKGYMFYA